MAFRTADHSNAAVEALFDAGIRAVHASGARDHLVEAQGLDLDVFAEPRSARLD